MTLLWHEDQPIGICVFTAPARQLRLRNQFFRLPTGKNPLLLQWLNTQLWTLARVVLHPTYRGAGLARAFVLASCQSCPVPWIEALSTLGPWQPFFERAGFQRIGVISKTNPLPRDRHQQLFGSKKLTSATLHKSLAAEPVYYLYDNRP